ncbi:MAG: long-chain fatty acid--CoA ligase [Candidatus Omnitrophota bacterium]
MIPENLGELLSTSAKEHSNRTAIVFEQKKISYKSLDELTDSIASGLIGLGIRKNDKVALLLENSPEFLTGYYSILKAGAIVVPVNYMFKMEEAKFILQDSQATCIITCAKFVDMAEELRLRVDTLSHIITTDKVKNEIPDFNDIKKEDRSSADAIRILPEDLAAILYTSGTTGYPKGVMLSHNNLISNAMDSREAIKVTYKDTFICILPLFHSFAATVCMNLPLLVGAKIVISKSVSQFKHVVRSIIKNRVRIFVAVPSVYNILKDTKLSNVFSRLLMKFFNPLKICVSGAAALPAETLLGFEKRFKIPLLEGYGLTEASPVVTMNPLRGERKINSIGIPLSKNVELKIIGEKNNVLGPEETGELLVKGPGVMQGYYMQKEATSQVLKDGWLYTGDMAKIDKDGYVYIVGRKKEMINVRGLNVYPREIEEVLYQNHKIKEAAVIGIPDMHKGEVPKAFVVLKEGEKTSEQEIIQYLREKLASFKVPKSVEFRSILPKNTTGKILKRQLKDEEKKAK